jgi:hypothetical protein
LEFVCPAAFFGGGVTLTGDFPARLGPANCGGRVAGDLVDEGLAIAGLVAAGLVTAAPTAGGLVMVGLVKVGFVIVGLAMAGLPAEGRGDRTVSSLKRRKTSSALRGRPVRPIDGGDLGRTICADAAPAARADDDRSAGGPVRLTTAGLAWLGLVGEGFAIDGLVTAGLVNVGFTAAGLAMDGLITGGR